MGSEVIVFPFLCGLMFFVVFFGYLIILRFMEYRETVALAEKGLIKQAPIKSGNGQSTLRWGISIAAIGLALTIGIWPTGLMPGSDYPLGIAPWLLVGLLPLFFGLGLVLIYVLTRDAKKSEPAVEPPASPTETK